MKPLAVPLRWFIPGIVFFGLTIFTIIFSFYLNHKTQTIVYSKVLQRLDTAANSFMFGLQVMRGDFNSKENHKNIQRILENAAAIPQISAVYLVRPDMVILLDGERKLTGEPVPAPLMPIIETSFKNIRPYEVATYINKVHQLILVRPIEGGEYDVARRSSLLGGLAIVYDLRGEDVELRKNLIAVLFFQTAGTILLALLVFFTLRWRFQRPLSEFAEAVSAVGRLNFSKKITGLFNDELGAVGSAFNLMTNEVRKSTENLEQKVAARTSEINELRHEVLFSAHHAGMAEVATGILHNIGNILNSVNVGVETMQRLLERSEVSNLKLANGLLNENILNIGDFLTKDKKGKLLPQFYIDLGSALESEVEGLKTELIEQKKRVKLISDVVIAHQANAKGVGLKEKVFVPEAIENAIAMQSVSLVRHDIRLVKKVSETQPILAQKAKLIHVILNLIKNAKESMAAQVGADKILTIESGTLANREVFIKVSDTGVGVSSENLKQIFTHGFSTKKEGHGFGLHFCANALAEMDGNILVESKGIGKGATFTITFQNKAA